MSKLSYQLIVLLLPLALFVVGVSIWMGMHDLNGLLWYLGFMFLVFGWSPLSRWIGSKIYDWRNK